MKKITEFEITQALSKKHNKDLFVSQCKLGYAGTRIIDAVAIKKTWSPITIIGYEIKCSRQDFLNDQKYPAYMERCTHFSFVCPKGIIDKNELPPKVGLIYYNPEKKSLRTAKRAVYKNITIDSDMLLHIMFWKMENYNRPLSRAEYLEDVKAKIESKDYGFIVGKKIYEYERKINRLKKQLEINGSQWNDMQTLFNDTYGYYPTSPHDVMLHMKGKNDVINPRTLDRVKMYISKANELIKEK